MNIFKIFGILLSIVGIGVLMIDNRPNAEIPLLVGLFVFFVVKDKNSDERTISLKASATYLALILAYAIKLISTNLFQHRLLSVHLVEINHFLILIFGLAILIYYLRLYLSSRVFQ